jgi:hypothetical protein
LEDCESGEGALIPFLFQCNPKTDNAKNECRILGRLRLPIIEAVIFAAVASHIESIRGSDPAVPMSRVLYRALLVSEVCIDQTISLSVALCPLEVVE